MLFANSWAFLPSQIVIFDVAITHGLAIDRFDVGLLKGLVVTAENPVVFGVVKYGQRVFFCSNIHDWLN